MKKKILLAAGGTGGHVFPAFAIAEVLKEQRHDVYWATDKRGLKYASQWHGPAPVVTRSASPANKLKFLMENGIGLIQALMQLVKIKPDAVAGFGGYPSVPMVAAAQILNIPTIIHQSDAVLGLANRFLARHAKAVAGGFPIDHPKAVLTGNPVRPDIAVLADAPYMPSETLNILVFGGSLGARIFADLMPRVMENMTPEFREKIVITQQVVDDEAKLALNARYNELGIRANLLSFIIGMPMALEMATLVISRSGASTVAELTCAGKPAVFIPYPHHGDCQQYANAEFCAKTGGALVLDEKDGLDKIASVLQGFLVSKPDLAGMARAMHSLGRPKAAWTLAELIIKNAA